MCTVLTTLFQKQPRGGVIFRYALGWPLAFLDVENFYSKRNKVVIAKKLSGSKRAYMS